MRQVNPETGMIDFPYIPDNYKHRQPRAKPGELVATINSGIEETGDECLIWPFSIGTTDGYAAVSGNKMRAVYPSKLVHRIVCIAVNGPPPEDKPLATHRCGNRPCINGRHLRWGSHSDNLADMVEHGRARW